MLRQAGRHIKGLFFCSSLKRKYILKPFVILSSTLSLKFRVYYPDFLLRALKIKQKTR